MSVALRRLNGTFTAKGFGTYMLQGEGAARRLPATSSISWHVHQPLSLVHLHYRQEEEGRDEEVLRRALQDKANLQAQVHQLRGQVSP